jgi:Protein of unknown function (DUF4231)
MNYLILISSQANLSNIQPQNIESIITAEFAVSESSAYKKERLEDQINWHSKKARHNKVMFRLYQIITLVASAIIPVINVSNIGDFQTRITSSIISAIIAVSTSITQLEKYQENWILYRTNTELLKKEKFFFENNAGEYSNLADNERNKLLVEKVESIVSAETSKYFTIYQPQKKPQQPQENEKASQT